MSKAARFRAIQGRNRHNFRGYESCQQSRILLYLKSLVYNIRSWVGIRRLPLKRRPRQPEGNKSDEHFGAV